MEIRKSERKKAKIKMALQGPSGAGKTMSSILIAKSLSSNNLKKVTIIDTENGSADLYAHLGEYNVITLKPPFTPENYEKAIDLALGAGMEILIVDSLSHTWNELLDYHSKLAGNSFTNWNKVNPRLNSLINKILQCEAHVIVTMRTKQDYVLNQRNGKYIPEKVGLKSVMKDGVDFEFTLVFDIDSKHNAIVSKDRTSLFSNVGYFKITENTGKILLEWSNNNTLSHDELKIKIEEALSLSELTELYKTNPKYQKTLNAEFVSKKQQLEQLINLKNFSNNGNHTSN